MRAASLILIAACGRANFEPQLDARIDAPVDAAVTVVDAAVTVVMSRIDCSAGAKTANQICTEAGYQLATVAAGYHWFECAGPGECPVGWGSDGLSCADWCGGADCSGWQYCGAGQVITERSGDASLLFDSGELVSCVGWNPGWLVRAACQ